MKIVHFSDLHVWRLGLELHDAWYPKRMLGYVNLALRRKFKYPPELGRAVVAEILKTDADAVIFTGDMTTASLLAEFEDAAELLSPLLEKWGERFIVLPGNHDRYTPYTIGQKFFECLFPGSGPVTRTDLGDRWSIVAFDASRPFMVFSNGVMTLELAAHLAQTLREVADTGRKCILAGHYAYDNPPGRGEGLQHRLLGAQRLIEVINDFKPPVYLHGHKHVRWVFQSPKTPDTVCINSGSAGLKSKDPLKRAGFVTIEVDDGGAIQNVLASAAAPDSGSFETLALC